ncbi:hypothetical protein ONE63_007263 [Megalurothrips usitatus]|uniref:FP protein C-terminal domain-containing protein n=1 Tax=Megalurothrips usitatus TaxID=439358 RepID=A0AAV7XUS9_9NEOP|nr:hypothetical protein ONE63_007263 [Megalurothrips usitatus]
MTAADKYMGSASNEVSADNILELKQLVMEMKEELTQSLKGQQFVSDQYDDMKRQIAELVLETRSLNEQVSDLLNQCAEKDKVILMQEERIQHLENHSRNRNIVLTADIEAAHRIPTQKQGMPKPIVVEFTSRKTRDLILTKKRRKDIFNSDVVESREGGKIFIFEHFSPKLMSLKYKGKQVARLHNWKYVWDKKGKLYARKVDNSPVIKIVVEEHLKLIK